MQTHTEPSEQHKKGQLYKNRECKRYKNKTQNKSVKRHRSR